ncbi:MAG: transposase [Chloroflexi bacterium]|nr:MAG: transposase [Chloroflexota bacterium]
MPKRKRVQREHTEDWQTIQQYTFWPEQTAYELLRPVVLFGDPAIQRAQETGEPRTSLERKADTFDEQGMVSLFASRPRKQPQETARSLPPDMRQLIVDLRVEMPNMSIREIAEICDTRFHRRPSHHSIKIVLASGPPPSIQMRRFPLFDDTPDPAQRRHNIVQLHAEGWSVASIAEYLGVSKQTVYTTLKRWWQEGVKGLDDKSHARKAPRKVTLEVTNEIRKKQENPLIGEWRMHAVLLQEGIKLSPRTCGRIMAKNRAIYGWDKPKAPPKPKKEMPFKATRRHEYWSIDIRYIEQHQLPNIKGPVYVMSVLENFSRMLLASAISERQDTTAYLKVLAKALRNYGAPEAIVTDSGGVFYSKRAMAIYEALDIRKERIDPRQSWQNYIEAHFGIMRRLADYYLNKAPTLDEMKKAHRKFIRDYNTQIHFAHRERNDNRHSPQDVLRGVLARTLPAPTLARIFFATEFTRHLDRSGYIRFRRWRFYAESGLAKQEVQVSFYTSTLKIEYQETELAFYTMEWEDNKRIKEVKNPRLIETGYRSPQLTLWTLGPDEWLLFLRIT